MSSPVSDVQRLFPKYNNTMVGCRRASGLSSVGAGEQLSMGWTTVHCRRQQRSCRHSPLLSEVKGLSVVRGMLSREEIPTSSGGHGRKVACGTRKQSASVMPGEGHLGFYYLARSRGCLWDMNAAERGNNISTFFNRGTVKCLRQDEDMCPVLGGYLVVL